MTRIQTRGDCVFCGREFAKSAIGRHLSACAKRKEAQAQAELTTRQRQSLYHLQVQDAWGAGYFLHLEMRGEATLRDLDYYLRTIWLECCGHLSAFEINSLSYDREPDPWMGRSSRTMNIKVNRLFQPGMEFGYQYDFGTTSELTIKVIAQREGRPLSDHPIFLMARNKFEPPPCMVCGKPATWLCTECMYDEEGRCELCDEHAQEHEHEDMLLALVNSPRTGMCGYSGPAEPPY
jgi:hypothetical protein